MTTSIRPIRSIANQCRDFLDVYAGAALPATAAGARRRIDDIVSTIDAREAAQQIADAEDAAESDRLQAIREGLRTALRPIVTIARVNLRYIAELSTLKMPTTNASVGALIHAAHAAADVVTRYTQVFEAEGLEPFTALRLRGQARDLDHAVTAARASMAWRHRNVEDIVDEEIRLRRALVVLNSLVLSWLSTRPELASHWREVYAGRAIVFEDRHAA